MAGWASSSVSLHPNRLVFWCGRLLRLPALWIGPPVSPTSRRLFYVYRRSQNPREGRRRRQWLHGLPAGEVCPARRPERRRWRPWRRRGAGGRSAREHPPQVSLQPRTQSRARAPWRRQQLHRRGGPFHRTGRARRHGCLRRLNRRAPVRFHRARTALRSRPRRARRSFQPSAAGPHAPSPGGHRLGRWQFRCAGCCCSCSWWRWPAPPVIRRGDTGSTSGTGRVSRNYGILKVEDPTMLQAIARWTPEPNCWRWRVHFPPGRYDLCCATTGIPADGLPKPQAGFTQDFSGSVDVSAAIYKDPQSGVWRCEISANGTGNSPEVSAALIHPPLSTTSGVEWKHAPATVSPEHRLFSCGNESRKRTAAVRSVLAASNPVTG